MDLEKRRTALTALVSAGLVLLCYPAGLLVCARLISEGNDAALSRYFQAGGDGMVLLLLVAAASYVVLLAAAVLLPLKPRFPAWPALIAPTLTVAVGLVLERRHMAQVLDAVTESLVEPHVRLLIFTDGAFEAGWNGVFALAIAGTSTLALGIPLFARTFSDGDQTGATSHRLSAASTAAVGVILLAWCAWSEGIVRCFDAANGQAVDPSQRVRIAADGLFQSQFAFWFSMAVLGLLLLLGYRSSRSLHTQWQSGVRSVLGGSFPLIILTGVAALFFVARRQDLRQLDEWSQRPWPADAQPVALEVEPPYALLKRSLYAHIVLGNEHLWASGRNWQKLAPSAELDEPDCLRTVHQALGEPNRFEREYTIILVDRRASYRRLLCLALAQTRKPADPANPSEETLPYGITGGHSYQAPRYAWQLEERTSTLPAPFEAPVAGPGYLRREARKHLPGYATKRLLRIDPDQWMLFEEGRRRTLDGSMSERIGALQGLNADSTLNVVATQDALARHVLEVLAAVPFARLDPYNSADEAVRLHVTHHASSNN